MSVPPRRRRGGAVGLTVFPHAWGMPCGGPGETPSTLSAVLAGASFVVLMALPAGDGHAAPSGAVSLVVAPGASLELDGDSRDPHFHGRRRNPHETAAGTLSCPENERGIPVRLGAARLRRRATARGRSPGGGTLLPDHQPAQVRHCRLAPREERPVDEGFAGLCAAAGPIGRVGLPLPWLPRASCPTLAPEEKGGRRWFV